MFTSSVAVSAQENGSQAQPQAKTEKEKKILTLSICEPRTQGCCPVDNGCSVGFPRRQKGYLSRADTALHPISLQNTSLLLSQAQEPQSQFKVIHQLLNQLLFHPPQCSRQSQHEQGHPLGIWLSSDSFTEQLHRSRNNAFNNPEESL